MDVCYCSSSGVALPFHERFPPHAAPFNMLRAHGIAPTLSKSHLNKFTRALKVRVLYISHLFFLPLDFS